MPTAATLQRRVILEKRKSLVDQLKQRDKLVGLWRASAYRNDGSQWLKDLSGKGHHLKLGSTARGEILDGALLVGGTGGNYAFTADSAAIEIAGDIDIRVVPALDDYTPAANNGLIAKFNATGNQRSWYLRQNASGFLQMFVCPDGITAVSASSTAVNPATDGSIIAIRVTVDVDNGAAGWTTKFYTKSTSPAAAHADCQSDSGWTQLGADVVTATATSIFNGTASLVVGAQSDGTNEVASGKFYAACVKNGIAGATVAAPNFNQHNDGTTSFTDAQGNVWHLPYAKVQAGQLVLPGILTNNAQTPDASTLDITSDLDLAVQITPNDYTPAANAALIAKWTEAGNQRSYMMRLSTGGFLQLLLSADGTTAVTATSSAVTGLTDGTMKHVRATWRQSDGRVQFFLSDDGSAWTQLGTDQAAAVASIFASTAILNVGHRLDGTLDGFVGKVHKVTIRSGIGGTIVANPDFTTLADGTTSFVDSTGKVWTVNATNQGTDTNDPKFLKYDGQRYVYLPGVASNYLSVPDAANLDGFTAATFEWVGALDDWTPATQTVLFAKRQAAGQFSWQLSVLTTGILQLDLSTDGTAVVTGTTDRAPAVADGATLHIRASWRASDGRLQFFTRTSAADPWVQLGINATIAIASVFDSTSIVEVGTRFQGGSNMVTGKMYSAAVHNTDLGSGSGVPVLDIDTSVATPESTTFLATTGQTVTINRSATGRKAVVVVRDTFLFGTDDTMTHPNHADFNFAATESLTAITVPRLYGEPAAHQVLFSKRGNTPSTAGWEVAASSAATSILRYSISDGTLVSEINGGNSIRTGAIRVLEGIRNVANDHLRSFVDAVIVSTVADNTTGSLSVADGLRISGRYATLSSAADMEWFTAALIRESLTERETFDIVAELVS